MKHRILSLLLVAILLLSLVACGSDSTENSEQSAAKLNKNPKEQITPIPIESVSEDMFGTCSWSLYTNAFTGLQYELPENWGFYTNVELAKRCGITVAEGVSPTNADYAQALKINGICYDTIAYDTGSADKVVIRFENMGFLYGKNMNEQEFADMMLAKENENLTGLDAGVTKASLDTLSIAGTSHPCIHSVIAEDGHVLYRTQVFIQYEDYMLVISGMSMYEGNGATLLGRFATYTPSEGE